MVLVSQQVKDYMEKASWIRKMFEAGSELKNKHGAENVFDFSLGNPDLPPPEQVKNAMLDLASSLDRPYSLGYMPNAGLPEFRSQLAAYLSSEQEVDLKAEDVIITNGAAGGINALFRAIFQAGDQVVCPAPFFVEYGFYAQNFQGRLTPVKSRSFTFELDLKAIEQAIGPETRVVLINSPNNPTGRVYTRKELQSLVDIIKRKNKEYGRPIILLSDEPYRFLVFDGVEVPSVMSLYEHSIVVSSFSKSLSMAGERVGYLAVHPELKGKEELMNALNLTNRILGFVNAPVIGQILAEKALNISVDVSVYAERRSAMARVLDEAGINYSMPQGSFYFFPEAPGGDDQAFVRNLFNQNVLAVPGTGFGYPGYVRMAFCVSRDIIERSGPALKKAVKA